MYMTKHDKMKLYLTLKFSRKLIILYSSYETIEVKGNECSEDDYGQIMELGKLHIVMRGPYMKMGEENIWINIGVPMMEEGKRSIKVKREEAIHYVVIMTFLCSMEVLI